MQIRKSVAAALGAVLLIAGAALPAEAATVRPTTIKVNASPEPVAIGGQVTVKGTLKYRASGQMHAAKDKRVTILFDPAGTAGPRKLATVRTTSTGAFTYKHTQRRDGAWIAKFAGTARLAPDRARDAVAVYEKGPWNYPGPDLDCSDIREVVWVGNNDYHDLDADGDGWGCDSWA